MMIKPFKLLPTIFMIVPPGSMCMVGGYQCRSSQIRSRDKQASVTTFFGASPVVTKIQDFDSADGSIASSQTYFKNMRESYETEDEKIIVVGNELNERVTLQFMAPIANAKSLMNTLMSQLSQSRKLPPIQVDDNNLLLFDVVLIVNLAVAISFWVIHRMNFDYIGVAFSEGCLMSLLWIGSGLFTGAFLFSAVNGHNGPSDTKNGGPKGASLLAANTFMNAVNMRLVFALLQSIAEHRPVGSVIGEEIMQLEIGFGFILMVLWRALHSIYVTRI